MSLDQSANSEFSSIANQFLSNPSILEDSFPHTVNTIEFLETHISWIILTGEFAYKIKKPVNLDFLDFSSLSKRKFYCEEEIRLNKKWAPDIYLDVIPISIALNKLVLGDNGNTIEYAVRMKQFPSNQTLDLISEKNHLDANMIDSIAHKLSKLHKTIDSLKDDSSNQLSNSILSSALGNFKSIQELNHDSKLLTKLLSWTNEEFQNKKTYIEARIKNGFIRECHGDLHLGNMAWVNDQILFFDGIEFNEKFRNIDVISEVAFIVMDLMKRKKEYLAWRFLNLYLEETGDYEGLTCLRFYLTYRAMVRAKVACIRSRQDHLSETEKKHEQGLFLDYLSLAESFIQKGNRKIIITCGYSGSGKTSIARRLYSNSFIHIRSDIERKRIFANNTTQGDIYTQNATDRTYERLLELTKVLIKEDFTVIVDATFLESNRREPFRLLAHELDSEFLIIQCIAKQETLKKRIEERMLKNNDVSDATTLILAKQIAQGYNFTELEESYLITLNTEEDESKLNIHLDMIKKSK